MRISNAVFVIACAAVPLPLAAQLTTTYKGFQREGGKEVPATTQFSLENGRVAMVIKGTNSARILFDAKAQVLRMVSDDEKTWFEILKNAGGGPPDPGGMMAQMQKQLAQMPAAQRAMVEQMMKSATPTGSAPQFEYVWTKDKKTIAGYECTRVEGKRGSDKVSEYCGTTSDDFKLSPAEHQTMLDMQGYLRNFTIMVRSPDDATRAFQWDTSVDGYPVLTRCFRNGELTLELTLASFDRKALSDTLFVIPSGYKKMDLARMGK
jgi:hypothetical protein